MKGNILPTKLKLSYILSLFEFPKNSSSELLSNFSEISEIINSNIEEINNFLYTNKKQIENILYNENKIINFTKNYKNINIQNYFYLSLLLYQNTLKIDYNFFIEYINEIYNYQKSIDNNYKYKKIIIAKIIVELINYYIYMNSLDINKYVDKLFKNILNESNNIIKDNIKIFDELNLNFDENYFINERIDIIYINIILAFLKKGEYDDVKSDKFILNQLGLKSIKLTNKMIKKLSNFENEIIKQYMINKKDDLYDEKKINFYYISLKFIFKRNIFIYYYKFLLEARKIIIKIINEKSFLYFGGDNKTKIEYIIKRITDSGYYYNKFKKNENFTDSIKFSFNKSTSSFPHYHFYSELVILLHKNISEFTKNINNKILINVGTENKISVFNDSLKIIDKINLNNWVNSLEYRSLDNDNLSIIVCTKNEILTIYFSTDYLINNHLTLKRGSFNFLLKVNNNQFLICEEKFISMEKEGFNILNKKNFFKCFEGYYREGIKLNESLIAFTSNKVVSRGEDKLIIYDYLKEIIVLEKFDYSFILSSTGLSVIYIP